MYGKFSANELLGGGGLLVGSTICLSIFLLRILLCQLHNCMLIKDTYKFLNTQEFYYSSMYGSSPRYDLFCFTFLLTFYNDYKLFQDV